jgi:CSLREA domain-containing protein
MKRARLAAAAAGMLAAGQAAFANEFHVNTTADGDDGACDVNHCTLREAVILSTGTGGPDEIYLQAGVYTLSLAGIENSALAGDLDVNFGGVTIHGMGPGLTIIDAAQIDRLFEVAPVGAATLELRDLTLRNGRPPALQVAGAIVAHTGSTLTLANVEITGCMADDDGGALHIRGTALIEDSIIWANSVTTSFGNGGGIHVANTSPGVTLVRSTVTGNHAANGGGGCAVQTSLELIDSTVSNNTGASPTGILMHDAFGPSVTATGSTFSGNRGVVLLNGSLTSATFENCTFSGSTVAPALWAGISGGTLALSNCTVTANAAGGLQRNGGTVSLKNTIVAGNGTFDINGQVGSLGYNLIGNTALAVITGVTTGNLLNVNPMLGPLADNGGPTFTHELLGGSPAVDAANPIDYPATDQRGQARPFDGDGAGPVAADMGAFEVGPGPITDCNGNGTDDAADIAGGTSADCNANGVPDECDPDEDGTGVPDDCEALGDLDGNGTVSVTDFLALLKAWGPCTAPPAPCAADLDDDGEVGITDFLELLSNWSA